MATFDFPYHMERTEYPADSKPINLGNGYTFSTKPTGPPQRTFILKFPGMKWFVNVNGTIDKTTMPAINMGRLDSFYADHRLYKTFTYPHPIYGNLTVRFSESLKHPNRLAGGTGVTEEFEVKLIEDVGA